MAVCFYFGLSAPRETHLPFHENPDGDCGCVLMPALTVDWAALQRLDMHAVERCHAEWDSERRAGLLHPDAHPLGAYPVRVGRRWVDAVFLDRDTFRLKSTGATVSVDEVQWR
jgi:hypothetical protein